jgi:hypothetical protein
VTYVLCPNCNLPMRGSVTSETGVRCPRCRGTSITSQNTTVLTKTPLLIETPPPLTAKGDPSAADDTVPLSPGLPNRAKFPVVRPHESPARRGRVAVALPIVRTGVWIAFLLFLLVEVIVAAAGESQDAVRLAAKTFRVIVAYTATRALDTLLKPG